MAKEALDSGRAFDKFKALVKTQGGDLRFIEHTENFEKAPLSKELRATTSGYITKIDTAGVGVAAAILGAGRETKESTIDYSAGIRMKKKIGDYVNVGDTIAVCYCSEEEKMQPAIEHLIQCLTIDSVKPDPLKLVVDIVR